MEVTCNGCVEYPECPDYQLSKAVLLEGESLRCELYVASDETAHREMEEAKVEQRANLSQGLDVDGGGAYMRNI